MKKPSQVRSAHIGTRITKGELKLFRQKKLPEETVAEQLRRLVLKEIAPPGAYRDAVLYNQGLA